MKNNIYIGLNIFIMVIGYGMALSFIYPENIELSNPQNGSYALLISSIIIFLIQYFKNRIDSNIETPNKNWTLLISNFIFWLFAFFLALICLYALPLDNHIEPLSSSLYLLSGVIVLSANFFMKRDPNNG
jgi:dolichol kinase